MKDEGLIEQAERLEGLLPRILRRMFTLEPDHPVADMPLAQLRVCSILTNGPKTISAIGEELRTSTSAITQLADRMEKAGLVERFAGSEDRRIRELSLTQWGGEIMRARRETRVRRAAEALELMTAEERGTLLESLCSLLKASEATAPEVPSDDPVVTRLTQ